MKSKVVVLLMILVLTCISIVLTNIMPAKAQERTVGVKVGDWFKYGYINVDWYDNSSTLIPQALHDMNNTEWALITVTDVSSTLITYQITQHYKNNTEIHSESYIDVETGLRPFPHARPYQFISADLSENDVIFSSEPEERINKTIIRGYFNENRETNHLSFVETGDDENGDYSISGYNYQDYYWDRATGVLVECSWNQSILRQEGGFQYVCNLTFSNRIVETNRWIVPESPNIEILSPENKTYTTDSVSLSFTIDKETSWISYSLDGQANITITGNTTLSELSVESHSLIVFAKDIAGNTGASETIYFTIEIQQAEPFPMWIIAIIVIVAVAGITLAIYFTKVKKTTERVKQNNVISVDVKIMIKKGIRLFFC